MSRSPDLLLLPTASSSSSSYTQHLFYARRPSEASPNPNLTMPRPNAPPTPGSSSDLRGKEGVPVAPTFHLPPNAFQDADRASTSSATPSANGSDSSYRPVSPTSPADSSRKRPAPQPSESVVTKDDFALPPPPTRSRKIIQMKPRQSEQEDDAPQATTHSAAKPAAAGGKKGRNASNTTAAGRKIARKTAHSLIERRRRSKMNEEFGVLKDMIPACKGQDMHKLAILQASIDYLRYLERCVADLQAQNDSPQAKEATVSRQPNMQVDHEDDEDEDEEMEDGDDREEDEEDDEEVATTASTPATNPQDRSASLISLPSLSQITTTTTTSPSIFSTNGGGGRHYSISSASQASYSPYFHSNQTSPAFGPQLSSGPTLPAPFASSRETFGLGSPAMRPLDSSQTLRKIAEGAALDVAPDAKHRAKMGRSEQDLDHEATAALLMLNNDRRNWKGGKEGDVAAAAAARSGTGMSVKDLLSG